MQQLELAVAGLEHALTSPTLVMQQRSGGSLTDALRHQLASLTEALSSEDTSVDEHWLSARANHLLRERDHLLQRLGSLLQEAAAQTEDSARERLLRLVRDIAHHHQRMHDLAYAAVGWDIGGSE